MWSRLATVCLVWLSLSGLLPAAACVLDMQMELQGSTQTGGCDEHPAPADGPIQLECCAFDHMAGPPAHAGLESGKRLLLDVDSDDLDIAFLAPQIVDPGRYARGSPPQRFYTLHDQSSLWLTTARLRL